ncbi:MAG: NAD-dependent epimerase/dehydratase family protein [Planctomycetota bacterium]
MGGTLITGATGFVGTRLVERLRARGVELHALARGAPPAIDGVHWHRAALEDAASVTDAVRGAAPVRVFHLGAMANPRSCEREPELATRVNVEGTRAVLAGAGAVGAATLVVGSAAVYGAAGRLTESAESRPRGVYGRTKLAAERAALEVAQSGQRVVVARSFNHSGAGQSTDYVLPALAAQIRAASAAGEPVATGNLFPVRDFLHVDDVLDAYELLLERGASGEVYNVCRGAGLSIGEALAGLQQRLGASGQRTRLDPERQRPDDAPEILGDPAKLLALGWAPQVTLEALLDDVASAAG